MICAEKDFLLSNTIKMHFCGIIPLLKFSQTCLDLIELYFYFLKDWSAGNF